MRCWAPFHFTIISVEILLLAQRAIFFNLLFKILLSLDHALNIRFSFPLPLLPFPDTTPPSQASYKPQLRPHINTIIKSSPLVP